ncbi:MAG: hypothetical protein IJ300_12965 [Clostridia bacterium]|nr:hypothetical protein [Clostridia bacterium]
MSRAELLQIFALLEANYEPQFAKKTDLNKRAMVNLWEEHFADKDYNLVKAAVNAYISTDTTGYVPNVGQINEQIRKLTNKEQMTEQEAVAKIIKATKRGTYYAEEEFEKLPPVLQRLVGSPEQIRVWGGMQEDEIQTVVASNLMRSYRAIAQKEELHQTLPSSIKAMLEQASERMLIE